MRRSLVRSSLGLPGAPPGFVCIARVLLIAVALLSNAATASACSAQPVGQDDPIATIDARLHEHAEAGRFSGSVLIARGGEVLYRQGFGLSDREAGVANTEDTQFNICSMGKTFTAAAVMLLVEEGRVDLNAPISTYLPDFPVAMADQISVHNLLSHTSGLGNYMGHREFDRNMARLTAIDQMYELVKQEELKFPPGTRFSYANSGYVVLGKIIENASGQTYFDFVRARIFAPLRMGATDFYLFSDRPEDVAFGYTRDGSGRLQREAHRAPNPASDGGVHSTLADLFAFDRALHEATLLRASSRDLMFTPNLNGYGYGLSIKPPDEHASERTSIGHTGGLMDRSTVLRHFIDDDTVIIVLSNFPAVAYEIAREIEAEMYGIEQAG